jgi:hypothetical protein
MNNTQGLDVGIQHGIEEFESYFLNTMCLDVLECDSQFQSVFLVHKTSSHQYGLVRLGFGWNR